MSVSHCMHLALAIAKTDRKTWAAQIDALPDCCEHADCGEPKSCQQRIREYMRMQWRIMDARSRKVNGE